MEQQALIIALIGVLGIGAQWIAWRTGWPAIALMLVAGIFAGPVTGLIDPHAAFGSLLEPAISIAVAVILHNPSSSEFGGVVAAPVFRDVAGYTLSELGVAPSGTTGTLFPTTW